MVYHHTGYSPDEVLPVQFQASDQWLILKRVLQFGAKIVRPWITILLSHWLKFSSRRAWPHVKSRSGPWRHKQSDDGQPTTALAAGQLLLEVLVCAHETTAPSFYLKQTWKREVNGTNYSPDVEKAMAPHSGTLAWKVSWTEEPGRLQSMGSLRVGHDWATSLWLFTFMHWRDCCWPTGHNCSLFFSPVSILTCPHPLPPPLLVLVADLVVWLKLSFLRGLRSLSARVVLLIYSQSRLGRKELKSTPSRSPELPMDYPLPGYKSSPTSLPTKMCIVKSMVFPVIMYGCESWTIKKAEPWKTGAFELWCWRRLLRVPWIARRSNQSILKEINPEISLEGLMLKLKLQYFGHLMQRAN